jgi:hypothetical protein
MAVITIFITLRISVKIYLTNLFLSEATHVPDSVLL